jgi:hypothetical protein
LPPTGGRRLLRLFFRQSIVKAAMNIPVVNEKAWLMRRMACQATALTLLLLASGCGTKNQLGTAAVTGLVTFHGQPVEGAAVTFMPKSGPVASGKTDSEGRFKLMTVSPGDGAVAGEHAVTVIKQEFVGGPPSAKNPYPKSRDILPTRYGKPTTSGLTAIVKLDGKNEFPFELK